MVSAVAGADEIITCVSCERSYKADILPPDNKKPARGGLWVLLKKLHRDLKLQGCTVTAVFRNIVLHFTDGS
ncbi:hypothetical protein ECPA4_2445, partial [Escherichia coli PA4]